jgi:hypothetical protein
MRTSARCPKAPGTVMQSRSHCASSPSQASIRAACPGRALAADLRHRSRRAAAPSRFARKPVDLFVNIAPDLPDQPHSRAIERQSIVSTPIPPCRRDKSATLRSSDDPLQSVGNPTQACAGKIAPVRFRSPIRDAGHADTLTLPPRGAGRVAGDPHRTDLLSAPYRGIVVAATIRIAPCPASTPNVELVTP